MCPECLTSAAVMVGGVISTGGVGALATMMLRPKKSPKTETTESQERRNDDGNSNELQTGADDRNA